MFPFWPTNLSTPADWVFLAAFPVALYFTIVYGGFTKWWRDVLGWVVLLYAVAVVGLLSLIVHGIYTGERASELYRFAFAILLFAGLIGKVIILHQERRRGNIEPQQYHRRSHPDSPTEDNHDPE